jgi:hypothetical protein
MLLYNLYTTIRSALEGVAEHIALWNQNVEFADQEEPWGRPAVFVEFAPVNWERRTKEARQLLTMAELRIHIVTDWHEGSEADAFEAVAAVRRKLEGLTSEHFAPLRLSQSLVNHNHEELVESIEVYTYRGYIDLGEVDKDDEGD